jgi:hypothetical protein
LPEEMAGIDPESRNDSTAAAGAPRTQPRSGQSVIGASVEMRLTGESASAHGPSSQRAFRLEFRV